MLIEHKCVAEVSNLTNIFWVKEQGTRWRVGGGLGPLFWYFPHPSDILVNTVRVCVCVCACAAMSSTSCPDTYSPADKIHFVFLSCYTSLGTGPSCRMMSELSWVRTYVLTFLLALHILFVDSRMVIWEHCRANATHSWDIFSDGFMSTPLVVVGSHDLQRYSLVVRINDSLSLLQLIAWKAFCHH